MRRRFIRLFKPAAAVVLSALLISPPFTSSEAAAQWPAAPSATPAAVVSGDLGARLDLYLTRLAAYGFSGTVLVAKGGSLILHKGYGLANDESGAPNTTETVYDVASIAKQFTAAAILKLEMEGKLRTSDPIALHLPGVPQDKRAITIHHLLTHSSGLGFDCNGSERMTREEFVKCMLSAKLAGEPGRQYFYSNGGYGLLSAIIETITRESYEKYLEREIFKPAGMTATGFLGDAKWPESAIARGYDEALETAVAPNGAPRNAPKLTWRLRGAAGVVTSTGDLYRWEKALGSNQILSRAATTKLFTPHVPTDTGGGSYGYGWAIAKTVDGRKLISHDGITFDGFNSLFQRYVDEKIVIIAASNRFSARFLPMDRVGPAISAIIFDRAVALPPAFIALDGAALDKYRGRYRLASGAELIVERKGERLIVGAEGQEAVNLLAGADEAGKRMMAESNERTAALIKAIAAGDYAPASRAFGMSEKEAADLARGWLGGLEKKNGPFKTFSLLGTVPEPGIARSFVRLEFERGVEIRRLRWEGERLGNIVAGRRPLLETTFRPQSATEFAGYHPGIGRMSRITFSFKPDGSASGLVIESAAGRAEAAKLQ